MQKRSHCVQTAFNTIFAGLPMMRNRPVGATIFAMRMLEDVRLRLHTAVDTIGHGFDYARHLVRGNRIPMQRAVVQADAPPVILVHGFLGTRGTMLPLTRRLQSEGRAVFTYSHGTFQTASLRRSAMLLAKRIRRICEDLNVSHVDVIGFSMGGLVALHAIKFMQSDRHVRRLVTLGSPFDGTWVALAGIATLGAISPSVWQVLPGSKFLRELKDAPTPSHVKIRQIHGNSDTIAPVPARLDSVASRDCLVLPGGHSTLVVADYAFEAIREFIAPAPHGRSIPGFRDLQDPADVYLQEADLAYAE